MGLLPSNTESDSSPSPSSDRAQTQSDPPVEEEETSQVEIETLGDAGDGIARVERGYVIIVPGTDVDERVRVKITDVQTNVAFASGVERIGHG